jgi:hypothetical protein
MENYHQISLNSKLKVLKDKLIVTDKINPNNKIYQDLRLAYNSIIKPLRSGNTIPNAMIVFDNPNDIPVLSKHLRIRNSIFSQKFPTIIDFEIFRAIYLFKRSMLFHE